MKLLEHEVALTKRFFPELQDLALLESLKPEQAHGQFLAWAVQIAALTMETERVHLTQDIVFTEGKTNLEALQQLLQELKPWRKGHFNFFGIDVDSEWRSTLKYQRLRQMLDPRGMKILDVGCGNAYYMLRLLWDGADSVLGIDPSWHYFAQYLLIKQSFNLQRSAFLPTTLDDTPLTAAFDLSLSMGVFYHRRDPLGHLIQLRNTLKNNGLLLLETLVVDGDEQTLLFPAGRYAGMKNVYFLPSPALLKRFVERCGFEVEALSEPVPTTLAEQRKTAWLDSFSLESFLNADGSRTVEDLPPPKRCMILARKRG